MTHKSDLTFLVFFTKHNDTMTLPHLMTLILMQHIFLLANAESYFVDEFLYMHVSKISVKKSVHGKLGDSFVSKTKAHKRFVFIESFIAFKTVS